MNEATKKRRNHTGADSLSPTTRAAVSFLTLFLISNSLLICLVSLCHPYSIPELPPGASIGKQWMQFHQTLVESKLLTFPAWLIGVAVSFWRPQTGRRIGTAAISLTTLLYFTDLISHLLIGAALLSPKTFGLMITVIPWFTDYTAQTDFRPIISALFAFGAFQVAAIFLSRRMTRTQRSQERLTHRNVWIAAPLILLLPLAPRLSAPNELILQLQKTPSRHPICASGLVSRMASAVREPQNQRELQVAASLVNLQPALQRFELDYEALKIASPATQTPDILIIMAESVRSDALAPDSAPNLTEFARGAMKGERHFSGGNASQFGLFASLFGLDSLFYDQAIQHMSPALPRLLQQAGYHCSFLGNVGIESLEHHHSIDNYINEEVFDEFELGKSTPYYEKDKYFIAKAKRLLNREGEFESLPQTPVCIFLFAYTTHSEYHFEAEDEIHTPVERDKSLPPPYTTTERQLAKNRYLNSIHCLDRLLKPLLELRNVATVFCGDHGESFGEDDSYFHGTALSTLQTQTPFIMSLPGTPEKSFHEATSHTDILPTLLDHMGIELNHPELLSGKSLLADDAEKTCGCRSLSVRANVSHRHVIYNFSRPKLSPLVAFTIAPHKPAFTICDVTDEMARPLNWSNHDLDNGIQDIQRHLNHLLGTEAPYIQKDEADTIDSLIDALSHPSTAVQLAALEVLAQMNTAARPAIPAINQCKHSKEEAVRTKAKQLVWDIATKD